MDHRTFRLTVLRPWSCASGPLAFGPDGDAAGDAADVSAAIVAYEATGGVVTPNSSLVTGYDFVGDAAATVAGELAAGLASTPTTLIQPPGEAPDGPNAWTASQLRGPLLSGDHDGVLIEPCPP